MTKNTNREHVKSIANTLDLIAYGQLYKCTECGETFELDAAEDIDDLEHCPMCGESSDETDFCQVTIFDWLEDVLDFDYIIGSDRQYKAARIMVACGGPNIYVNTLTGTVDLYWWGEQDHYDLSSAAVDAIDEAMEELFNC